MLEFHLFRTMWTPHHALVELSLVFGLGATGAGLIQLRYVEGRITLGAGVALLLYCTAAGAFS